MDVTARERPSISEATTRPFPVVGYAMVHDAGMACAVGKTPRSLPTARLAFKEAWRGCPVVMGRKTYESTGGKFALNDVVVLTREPLPPRYGVHQARDEAEAMGLAAVACELSGAAKVVVVGGPGTFGALLAQMDRVEVCETGAAGAGLGEAGLGVEWVESSRVPGVRSSRDELDFSFVGYARIA